MTVLFISPYQLKSRSRLYCFIFCWGSNDVCRLRNVNLIHLTSRIMTRSLRLPLKSIKTLQIFFFSSLSSNVSLYLTVSGFTSHCLKTFQTSSWQWFMCQIQYISNKPGLGKLNPIWWGIKLTWNAFTKAVANLILSTQSQRLLTWHMWGCVTLPSLSFHLIFLQLFPISDSATRSRCPRFNEIYYFAISVFPTCCSSKAFKVLQEGQQRKKT